MEPLNSCSLGAMGSLLRKLNELLCTEERVQALIGDLRLLSAKMEKLSEVPNPPLTVIYWMNDARELSYDMEVCVDQFVHASEPDDLSAKVARILAWVKEILRFVVRVKEVNERCDRYNLINKHVLTSPAKLAVSHHLPSLYNEPDPVGIEEPTNKLLEWLMPRGHGEETLKLKVVSVLGDEGVGKSTLVKRLWQKSSQDKFEFQCRAFVQTAKKPDTRMVLRSVLSQVHPKQPLKACKVPTLIDDLREHLQDKRYFIVIDGLWDVSVWHIIKRAFPAGNQRIITTTSVEKVARVCCSYDSNSIISVKCLCGDEAKKLFVDRAFGSEKGCPPQFNDATDEITRKCGGFPLAIMCTARIVASKPETEKDQQLDYVNKFLPNNLRTCSSSLEILNQVLKLCYGILPHCLRTCLLYLSMYPENYLFLKNDLVKQWMAEDFICSPEGSDIVDVANGFFDELVSLGLIQRMHISKSNNKELSYTVHPVVFEFITCKSMEDNFITIIDYSQSTAVLTEKIRRLSLHFGSATYATTPASVQLSQVRSLSFMGLLSCMPSIAEFILVRVVILHIHSDDGDTKFSLAEICKLLHLRYLQVRCNVTVDLPHQMQSLKYLETVEINAGVEYVPSGIFQLSGLLHVRLGRKGSQTRTLLSSLDWMSVPSPPAFLQSFEFLPPICIFSRLPLWFRKLHKLRIMEIVVRELTNSIEALEELPVLKHLSLYVRTPPTKVGISFGKDMFPALEYFKFVCSELSLEFLEETCPKLRQLKLVFNAHRGEEYRNMLAGISHLLSLDKVVASIGLAPNAVESDRIAAESAFNGAIRKHPRHRSFKVVKKLNPVDEDKDPFMKLMSVLSKQRKRLMNGSEELSNEHGKVPMWKLAFQSPPKLPIFTGTNIEDNNCSPLEVILVDKGTGSMSKFPKLLSVEVVPLAGDFPDNDHADWTAEEFQKAIVRQREGKRPLLTGDVRLTMSNGRAMAGEFQFTDNSSWVPSRKFRIGARVVPGSYDGGRIAEAITETFVVRDRRGELYRKHYPPVLGDSVWRLEKISKEGAFHRKLKSNNIETVQEFLRILTVKPDELRAILGDHMTDRMWEATTKHARTCVPDHNKLKVVKKLDPVDEGKDPFMKLMSVSSKKRKRLMSGSEELSNEHGKKLAFQSPPKLPIFTGTNIEDNDCSPLEVILVDKGTGSMSKFPKLLRVEVVPLAGDFPDNDHEDWTAEEFQKAIVRQREGKRPLLTGDVRLTMSNGRATAGEFQFTDNSSFVPCRKFRIGARVVPGSYDGGRIAEAITEAFVVRDRRGELYQKNYPPVLGDSVWRLDNITKEGAFHRKLKRNSIETVHEFLRMLAVKPEELRAILGDGMTDRMWEATTGHARTCAPGDKVYAYSSSGCTIYVNSVFKLLKVEIGGTDCSFHQLNSDQMMLVRQLILEAYEHPYNLMELKKRKALSLCRYPPSLGDSVWVLENITWGSTLHNKLERNNIKTVQEFLRMLMVKADDLRAILGDSMTDNMWEETTKHARTCDPGDKVYVYKARGSTIYVNSVFNLVKVKVGGTECPLQQLNWDQMMVVHPLLMEAYDHRQYLFETNAVTFNGNNATDNIALLRARIDALAREIPQTSINNMVPNPWGIQ